MIRFFHYLKKKGRLPALILLCAAALLALFLIPRELAFRAPMQEYKDNEVKVGKIYFSRPSGFYEEPFTLKIKAPTTEIYYTLDGTEPVRGQKGTLRYTGQIDISDATRQENVHSLRKDVTTGFDEKAVEELSKGRRKMNYRTPDTPVDKCTILRAAYYTLEGERSETETASYFVGFEGREGYGTARVLSVVTDPANLFDHEKGIYVTGKTFDEFAAADSFHNDDIWYRHCWWWWDSNYNQRGREWEREANVEFFGEDGSLILQQEAGIRIQGGGSRGFLPKSLNLYARREYDGNTRFHYDFFGTGFEAKRLTLTCGGDDCFTKQKDRLVSELAADQGFAAMHYEPFLLFLDGEFWGMYFLTEKFDEKYFSYYYDVPEEEIVEIKNNKLEIGREEDLAAYEDMKAFLEESDMTVAENYEKACSLIDMDSFINYYAALIYCSRSGDWPNGNFAVWRARPAPETAEEANAGNTGAETAGEREAESAVNAEAESAVNAEAESAAEAEAEMAVNAEAETAVNAEAAAEAAPGSGAGQNLNGDESLSPYRDGRWRWILFDVNSDAISSKLTDHDTLHYVIKANLNRMFGSLSENPQFREKFSGRLLEYGRTIFSPASVNEKVDQYAREMTEPMKIHFERFFGKDSGLDFTEITQTEIRDFFDVRYEFAEKMLEENFGEK